MNKRRGFAQGGVQWILSAAFLIFPPTLKAAPEEVPSVGESGPAETASICSEQCKEMLDEALAAKEQLKNSAGEGDSEGVRESARKLSELRKAQKEEDCASVKVVRDQSRPIQLAMKSASAEEFCLVDPGCQEAYDEVGQGRKGLRKGAEEGFEKDVQQSGRQTSAGLDRIKALGCPVAVRHMGGGVTRYLTSRSKEGRASRGASAKEGGAAARGKGGKAKGAGGQAGGGRAKPSGGKSSGRNAR